MFKKTMLGLIGAAAFAISGQAQAVPTQALCEDTANSGSGGANASSAIWYEGATVSTSNCGPWAGNDSKDLTAANGGYGYSDWFELDKADGGDGANITGTGWGTTSGTFTFTDAMNYGSYLIAMKFDGVYSTFLSDSVATNWRWDTDPDGDKKFAISHLVVYVRGNGTTVPEPGSFALLGIGLLGLGLALRRRAA